MRRSSTSIRQYCFILGIAALFISGCILPNLILPLLSTTMKLIPETTATVKIYPTRTPLPWPTVTLHPSITPYFNEYEATLMPERMVVENGYFSFQPLENFDITVNSFSASLDDTSYGVFIYAEGFEDTHLSSRWPDMIAQLTIDSYNSDPKSNLYLTGSYETLIVDEVEGTIFGLAGTWDEYSYEGAVMVFPLGDDLFVSGTCFAATSYDKQKWESKGKKDCWAFIYSLEFFTNINNSSSF